MTYKELVSLMVFIVVLFAMLFVFVYLRDQQQIASVDFIELPERVNINPNLK